MLNLSTSSKGGGIDSRLVAGGFHFSVEARGLTSKAVIKTSVHEAKPGTGLVFLVESPKSTTVEIAATTANVVNTLRNVTLGGSGIRLCIVEHLLAALSLFGLPDALIETDGLELPLGDGSADIWLKSIKDAGIARRGIKADVPLSAPCVVTRGDRSLIAVPDEKFSITYLMDWDHPAIGKKWYSWSPEMPLAEIGVARTFGSMKEHKLLGLENDVVSLTETGFSKELHFDNEPVRHKVLDIVGDLTLIGFNPFRLKARIISIKGGHEMDVELVKQLEKQL